MMLFEGTTPAVTGIRISNSVLSSSVSLAQGVGNHPKCPENEPPCQVHHPQEQVYRQATPAQNALYATFVGGFCCQAPPGSVND